MTKHFTFLALSLLSCAAVAAQPGQAQIAAKLSHIPASLSKSHCQGEYAYRTSSKTVSLDVMTFAGILQTDAAKMYPKHSDITVSSDFNDEGGKTSQSYGYTVTTAKGKYLNVFEGTASEYHIYSCHLK